MLTSALIRRRPFPAVARLQATHAMAARLSSSFNRPSPIRLPEDEQRIFEELQRASETAPVPQTPSGDGAPGNGGNSNSNLHPHARILKPEFDGDVNPKTGEVGGPKNEPLRWGSNSDWSFGGRVTDF